MAYARLGSATLIAVLLLFSAGCGTTQKASVKHGGTQCGLLGKYGAMMKPGAPDSHLVLFYIKPAVKWAQYNKVMIAPVTYWASEETSITHADQQQLIEAFHVKLSESLAVNIRSLIARPPAPWS